MARSTDALEECGDGARRAQLANKVDLTDVDAELERRGGHQHLELAALEAAFGVQPMLLGQTAMMCGHMAGTNALGKMPRDTLDHPPRVGEDQRRAMLADELSEPVVDLTPDLRRHDRLERGGWHLDGEVTVAPMPQIDDSALWPCRRGRAASN